MLYRILLMVHVCGATIGITAGMLSMIFRKGRGLHAAAGMVFVAAMLAMSSSAVYMAVFHKPNAGNVAAGLLTIYMVSTGWRAIRRRETQPAMFDTGAFVWALLLGAADVMLGSQAVLSGTGKRDGVPSAMYFVFGAITLLFAMSDARMIGRGGLTGAQRIRRHIWRMSFSLLFALLSFFPGQARLFPRAWLRMPIAYLPHVLLLGAIIYWLRRYRSRRASATKYAAATVRAA